MNASVALPFTGTYDWPQMTDWLSARAIPGVEAVTSDGRYVRSIALRGATGTITVRAQHFASALDASICFAHPAAVSQIAARVGRIFDVDADLETIAHHLGADPRLAPLLAQRPGVRVPGAWDGYEVAVRAVLGQQISVRAATGLAARLAERFGDPLPATQRTRDADVHLVFPRPEQLADADIARLGMPAARANAIRAVARAAAGDPQYFEPSLDLEASIERLRALPGVGEWTAHYIAMRALREPDAFPAADVGLMRALTPASGKRPTAREVARIAEGWRPWRAYAALHLWAADAAR